MHAGRISGGLDGGIPNSLPLIFERSQSALKPVDWQSVGSVLNLSLIAGLDAASQRAKQFMLFLPLYLATSIHALNSSVAVQNKYHTLRPSPHLRLKWDGLAPMVLRFARVWACKVRGLSRRGCRSCMQKGQSNRMSSLALNRISGAELPLERREYHVA